MRHSNSTIFARSSIFAAAFAFATLASAANRQMAGTLELAPFNDVTQAATTLGAMINQPLLPTMGLGACQQALMQSYGAMRSDAPIVWQAYLDLDAVAKMTFDDKNKNNNKNPFETMGGEVALLYPLAVDEAAFMRSHVGSSKSADGTIKLLAGGGRANETYAKFTADGSYCAFSTDAEIARLAAKSFAPQSFKSAPRALVRACMNEKGIDAIVTLLEKLNALQQKEIKGATANDDFLLQLVKNYNDVQQKQYQSAIKQARSCGSFTVCLGLDDKGLSIFGKTTFRKGAKPIVPAGTHLPAAAIDGLPSGIGVAGFYNILWQDLGDDSSAKIVAARDFFKALRELLNTNDDKDFAKYKQCVLDLVAVIEEELTTYSDHKTGKDDWASLALLFDDVKRPSLSVKAATALTPAQIAADAKALDRIISIIERQWPGSGIAKKSSDGVYSFDWANLIDVVAKETAIDAKNAKKEKKAKANKKGKKGAKGKKGKADEIAKQIAEAKKGIANILGGTTSVVTFKKDAKMSYSTFAALGATVPGPGAGQGAKRIFDAVPEAKKDALMSGFYLTPYAFCREVALPIYMKFADEEDRKEAQAMLATLPPAAQDGVLAAATWLEADGSASFTARLTANEIRCFGAAALAVTAASSSATPSAAASSLDDDD